MIAIGDKWVAPNEGRHDICERRKASINMTSLDQLCSTDARLAHVLVAGQVYNRNSCMRSIHDDERRPCSHILRGHLAEDHAYNKVTAAAAMIAGSSSARSMP